MANEAHIYTAPLMLVCLLLMTWLLVSFSYKLYHSKKKILLFYTTLTLTSMATFIVSSAIDFAELIYYLRYEIDLIHTETLYWLIPAANFFYGVSALALYMMVFGRLFFTFKFTRIATQYQMSDATVAGIVFLIAFNAVNIQFNTVLFLTTFTADRALFYQLFQLSFLVLDFSDLALSMAMLAVFVYKLQQIILGSSVDYNEYSTTKSHYYYDETSKTAQTHTHTVTNTSTNTTSASSVTTVRGTETEHDDEEVEHHQAVVKVTRAVSKDGHGHGHGGGLSAADMKLNLTQTKLITIITRHTILSSIAIISNQFFYVSIVLGGELATDDSRSLYYLAYSNLIKAVIGVVNAVSLYLNFGLNFQSYNKYCHGIHMYCYRCFERKTKRRMVHQITDRQMLAATLSVSASASTHASHSNVLTINTGGMNGNNRLRRNFSSKSHLESPGASPHGTPTPVRGGGVRALDFTDRQISVSCNSPSASRETSVQMSPLPALDHDDDHSAGH